MIFDVMQKHAKTMMASGNARTDCFVLERVGIDFEAMDKAWEKAKTNSRAGKFDVPVLMFGQKRSLSISRFSGSGPANASKQTYQKKKSEWDIFERAFREDEVDALESPFPETWFSWLLQGGQCHYATWSELLQKICDADAETLRTLFGKTGPLFTFDPKDGRFEEYVRKAVCFPVSVKSPGVLVHAVLAYNALHVSLLDAPVGVETLRFCLLFWVLETAKKTLAVTTSESDSERTFGIDPKTTAGGNLGNIDGLTLLIRVNQNRDTILGGRIPSELADSNEAYRVFLDLTAKKRLDTIKLGGIPYTAPATGKSPTNAFRTGKQNCLSPDVRSGFDRDEVIPVVDGFDALVKGTRFSLGGVINYYVFPEKADDLPEYVRMLRDLLSELRDYKDKYFKELKKSSGSDRAKAKRKEMLRELLDLRRGIWGGAWNRFPVSDWIFAFEEDVGGANQPQNTWTSVFRKLPLVRTYLLLFLADDPTSFGQLVQMLKKTAHNLNEGWEAKELKGLLAVFVSKHRLDPVHYWHRWRGYLVRGNQSEDPVRPDLWEKSMNTLLRINAIERVDANEYTTGMELITALDKRSAEMVAQNKEHIQEYLAGLFSSAYVVDTAGEKGESAREKVRHFVGGRAADYAGFVDAGSTGWRSLVDGLLCGWALKQACRSLRGKDYASAIGGRSLAKQTPAEVRTVMVELVEKAIRAGHKPWNIDVPLELLFKWSMRNAYSAETTLFMDALSLGFMRFDQRTDTETGDDQ